MTENYWIYLVKNLILKASNLANICETGDDRLRAVYFNGASGYVKHLTIKNVNKGPDSNCQEAIGIEVKNAPFDGSHPGTKKVTIKKNNIRGYQKGGIVANGDLNVKILNNFIGSANRPLKMASNSIQMGYGATGIIRNNHIIGNQWCGASDWVGSGILIQMSNGVKIINNAIKGNSDAGIFYYGNNGIIRKNTVIDAKKPTDCNQNGHDTGILTWGTGFTVKKNHVKGFDDDYVEW